MADVVNNYTALPRFKRKLLLGFDPKYPYASRTPELVDVILYYEHESDSELKERLKHLLDQCHVELKLTLEEMANVTPDLNSASHKVILDGGTGKIYQIADIDMVSELFLTSHGNRKFINSKRGVISDPYEAGCYFYGIIVALIMSIIALRYSEFGLLVISLLSSIAFMYLKYKTALYVKKISKQGVLLTGQIIEATKRSPYKYKPLYYMFRTPAGVDMGNRGVSTAGVKIGMPVAILYVDDTTYEII